MEFQLLCVVYQCMNALQCLCDCVHVYVCVRVCVCVCPHVCVPMCVWYVQLLCEAMQDESIKLCFISVVHIVCHIFPWKI